MRPDENADIPFREYLLDKLTENRQQHLEERLMTDEAVYEELLIQENELIDDYVTGNLLESDEEKFNRHFLFTTERHQKVRFARTFGRYLQSNAMEFDGRNSFWQRLQALLEYPALRFATAAGLVALVFGGVFSGFENRRLGRENTGLQSERSSLQDRAQDLQDQLDNLNEANTDLSDEIRRERDSRIAMEQDLASLRSSSAATSRPTVTAYVLQPGLLRDFGGQTSRVAVSEATGLVKLQLDIGLDDYASYRAVLHDVEGEEVWVQNKLEAKTRDDLVVVPIELPSSLLSPGDYYIRLSGQAGGGNLELVGRYHFRATPI